MGKPPRATLQTIIWEHEEESRSGVQKRGHRLCTLLQLQSEGSGMKSSGSVNSNSKSKMNVPMTNRKYKNKVKRNRSKTSATIKKLFNHLREESISSISSVDTTIIEVDNKSPSKRKLSPQRSNTSKRLKTDNSHASVIIIEDSVLEPTNEPQSNGIKTPRKPSPISCSTPIIKSQHDCIEVEPKTEIKSNNNEPAIQNMNEEIQDLTKQISQDLTKQINQDLTKQINQDLTKQINQDSYLTIDLTNETLDCSAISKPQDTVIDLEATNDDCTIIHASHTNLSMSGDSDVTVLNMGTKKKDRHMKKFVKGIAKLDASEKGKLLELITQNIFSGCKVASKGRSGHNAEALKGLESCATDTVEDAYIKEVILKQVVSRNSIGSNIYNPERCAKNKTGLRMIVIDGSNVAMEHGRGKVFSVKGLKICIEYFLKRGHTVKAFVPRFRCKFGKSSDPRLLDEMERKGHVVYTPSREIQGRLVTSYDDRYIVQCAAEFDGVIVSGDNYRDLLRENPRWRFVVENRLLQFTWVEDMIMFPRDPLGRNGPSLEQFLKHPPANNANLFGISKS